MDYLKYYWLERYLLGEVHANWYNRGYLLPEEFFSIVIWKRNASKTKIKRELLKLGPSLHAATKKLTKSIKKATNDRTRVELLLKQKGIGLALASAFLTVWDPLTFTVYDVRVRRQLQLKDFSTSKKVVDRYFDYIGLVRARCSGRSLRNTDRCLWAEDWHEDLKKFIRDK